MNMLSFIFSLKEKKNAKKTRLIAGYQRAFTKNQAKLYLIVAVNNYINILPYVHSLKNPVVTANVTSQVKATEQYFAVVLFIMLYKVILTFESEYKNPKV